MELKINMNYWQILGLISQLSKSDKERLALELNSTVKKDTTLKSLKSLILSAPTWSDEELDDFLQAREFINNSRVA